MKTLYSLIFVPSISHALACEKILERTGVPQKLIPVPRRYSSDCGVCIRIAAADRPRTESILSETGTVYDRIIEDA
ncbi:MAG: DUF3343 domain-containing protein [Spirochaetia bacterium]